MAMGPSTHLDVRSIRLPEIAILSGKGDFFRMP